jgi:AMP nucleosidase
VDRSPHTLTPEQAVDRLDVLHTQATTALREALARFVADGTVPTPEQRARFRYPELRQDRQP